MNNKDNIQELLTSPLIKLDDVGARYLITVFDEKDKEGMFTACSADEDSIFLMLYTTIYTYIEQSDNPFKAYEMILKIIEKLNGTLKNIFN